MDESQLIHLSIRDVIYLKCETEQKMTLENLKKCLLKFFKHNQIT